MCVCVRWGRGRRDVGMSGEATEAENEDGGGGSESLIGCELRENMKPGSLMNLRAPTLLPPPVCTPIIPSSN